MLSKIDKALAAGVVSWPFAGMMVADAGHGSSWLHIAAMVLVPVAVWAIPNKK